MKFQLFGRLRDNGDNNANENSAQEPEPGMSQQNDFQDFGSSGIQRTVENLFEQGYSEEEVRQELQGQYSRDEIQGAINQAVKTSATAEQDGPQPMTPYQENNDDSINPVDEGNPDNNMEPQNEPMHQQEMNPGPQPQGGPDPIGGGGPQPSNSNNSGNVEELIETIVAENFEKVENEFENVYAEIDELKEKAEDFEERIHDLEVRDDEDQQEFIQKVDEMEDHIDQYQSRIGGLEKAFQQVLPSLVDNVRDLTQLVQEIKQERGIETSSNVDQDDIEDIDMEEW